MLKIDPDCHMHLATALLHALNLGVEEQFLSQLQYLNRYGSPEGRHDYTMCLLYYDSAPYSFGFMLYHAELLDEVDEDGYRKLKLSENGNAQFNVGGKPFLIGGLIFHPGVGTSGIDDGSFAVELNPEKGPHWSIHT